MPVVVDWNLLDRENSNPEQKLAYFREDVGANEHHGGWHLYYPAFGPISVVDKDRRGELFFYFHRQITAR